MKRVRGRDAFLGVHAQQLLQQVDSAGRVRQLVTVALPEHVLCGPAFKLGDLFAAAAASTSLPFSRMDCRVNSGDYTTMLLFASCSKQYTSTE